MAYKLGEIDGEPTLIEPSVPGEEYKISYLRERAEANREEAAKKIEKAEFWEALIVKAEELQQK